MAGVVVIAELTQPARPTVNNESVSVASAGRRSEECVIVVTPECVVERRVKQTWACECEMNMMMDVNSRIRVLDAARPASEEQQFFGLH